MKKKDKSKGKVIRTAIVLIILIVGLCFACIPLLET